MSCYHLTLREVKGQKLFLPCGQCIGCRLERSRQWAARCTLEMEMHEYNSSVTLTYDNPNVPKVYDLQNRLAGFTLYRKHVTDFLKRLRYAFPACKFKYFGCGEYGEDFVRPHYHLNLFGLDFVDKIQIENTKSGYPQYISPELDKIWNMGRCTVTACNFETVAYAARYCLKKINGKRKEDHYSGKETELLFCSRRPGIGASWYKVYKNDIYPLDKCVPRPGITCRPPKFFDKKLEIEHPELYIEIKGRRQSAVDKFFPGWDRLRAIEKCKEYSVTSQLKRKGEINGFEQKSTGTNPGNVFTV